MNFKEIEKVKSFDNHKMLLTYGLSKDKLETIKDLVENLLPENENLSLFTTKCLTDCVGYFPYISIINTNKITDKDIKFINELYDEDSYKDPNQLFVGNDKRITKKCKICSEIQFKKSIEFLLLGAIKKRKVQENHSAQIVNTLKVLKAILNKRYISSSEIAEEVEISTRSVTRYIETLNCAGEDIRYDYSRKGWYSENNYSVLFYKILSEIKK